MDGIIMIDEPFNANDNGAATALAPDLQATINTAEQQMTDLLVSNVQAKNKLKPENAVKHDMAQMKATLKEMIGRLRAMVEAAPSKDLATLVAYVISDSIDSAQRRLAESLETAASPEEIKLKSEKAVRENAEINILKDCMVKVFEIREQFADALRKIRSERKGRVAEHSRGD